MNAVNLSMLKALREAGVPEELAEEAASSTSPAEHLATKSDLAELKAELKADMAQLESRLNGRMAQLESRLNERMAQLESRLNERIAKLTVQLISWMFAMAVLAVAVLTFLLK